jgi:hypothetical protein
MPPGPVLSFIGPASSLLNKLQRDDPLSCLADADLETHSQDLPLTSNYIIHPALEIVRMIRHVTTVHHD